MRFDFSRETCQGRHPSRRPGSLEEAASVYPSVCQYNHPPSPSATSQSNHSVDREGFLSAHKRSSNLYTGIMTVEC
jgi:hypothetical protein